MAKTGFVQKNWSCIIFFAVVSVHLPSSAGCFEVPFRHNTTDTFSVPKAEYIPFFYCKEGGISHSESLFVHISDR